MNKSMGNRKIIMKEMRGAAFLRRLELAMVFSFSHAIAFFISQFLILPTAAQPVFDIIKQSPTYASCNYDVYPDSVPDNLTPAPADKHPFYISHYGRHGSRYINKRSGYDIPYKMMVQAKGVDELTPTGKRVLNEMNHILEDSEKRWGDLTEIGREQIRQITRRMFKRFPEVFADSARVAARSTVVPRCIMSMESAMMELAQLNPRLNITMDASKRTQIYMNHQDSKLYRTKLTPEAQEAYDAYTATRLGNSRLMEQLFKNPDIIKEIVDESFFNYYMMKMGLFQMNTHFHMAERAKQLLVLFTTEDLYRMWQIDNALWYLQYGFCPLNGADYPYSQRFLLRQIIADADSCLRIEKPGAQLRFGHETVLLPLICLIGINGYDLQTTDLDEIEAKGWWSSSVFPMGANLQFIFYRSDPQDEDVLFKVLLNEQEATLPIATDSPPYYRWADFRNYCLAKLDEYEKTR